MVKEEKQENRGSVEFQYSVSPIRYGDFTDFSSERGLQRLLEKRQRLLASLAKKNRARYKKLIGQLDIRGK